MSLVKYNFQRPTLKSTTKKGLDRHFRISCPGFQEMVVRIPYSQSDVSIIPFLNYIWKTKRLNHWSTAGDPNTFTSVTELQYDCLVKWSKASSQNQGTGVQTLQRHSCGWTACSSDGGGIGVEKAFEVVTEVSEGVSFKLLLLPKPTIKPSIKMAKWVGDCFMYTISNWLCYLVGFESYTISPFDT